MDPTSASEIHQLLDKLFVKDSATQVWSRNGVSPMNYSDGEDIEQQLRTILESTQDLSADSTELQGQISDWPTRYYLSTYRANLLRPLRSRLKGRVLEIGAGCGALTRYLGETAEEVLAVEGSIRRAELCALRCRGLDNVQVVSEQFENLPDIGQFDVVTLIGVLEYARIYGGGLDGPLNLLKKAKEKLRPGGMLVVAIENQLGAKYFAGANEDHEGKPWVGVSDLYTEKGPVTFGRRELEKLLHSAEFLDLETFYPFPDYKLPISILTESGIEPALQAGFDLASFASLSTSADPHGPPLDSFPLETSWRAIGRNGLLGELANSFLIAARVEAVPRKQGEDEAIPVVYHYGSHRRKRYAKETLIACGKDGLHVSRIPLYPADFARDEDAIHTGSPYSVEWRDEPLQKGELYVNRLLSIVNTERWGIDDVADWIRPWKELLLAQATEQDHMTEPLANVRLPANYVDATPFNLLITKDVDRDAEPTFFDLEWVDNRGVYAGHVLIRGMISCLEMISSVASPHDELIGALNFYEIIHRSLSVAGIPISEERWRFFLRQENAFRRSATGHMLGLSVQSLKERRLNVRDRIEPVQESTSESETRDTSLLILDDISMLFRKRQTTRLLGLGRHELRRLEKISALLREQNSLNKIEVPPPTKGRSAIRLRYADFLNHPVNEDRFASYKNSRLFLKRLRMWVRIRRSGLFDDAFYRRVHVDLRNEKGDLLVHYIVFGASEGRQPNMLFDGRWYAARYSIPAEINPLLHYIIDGSKCGFDPHPLFKTSYYTKVAKLHWTKGTTTLSHYLTSGFRAGISPHPLFSFASYNGSGGAQATDGVDPLSYYLEHWRIDSRNPHYFFDTNYYLPQLHLPPNATGMNPLVHYIMHGGFEGKDPSREFSTDGYYHLNPDVREHGINALEHFVEHGASEGRLSISVAEYEREQSRLTIEDAEDQKMSLQPRMPTDSLWAELSCRARYPSETRLQKVDVIIPVYKGMVETLACIVSVLATTGHVPFRIVVINDCSPDEELSQILRHWASMDKFLLIENDQNYGFVESVNRGMHYAGDADVVLLNSDTEVYGDWLDRVQGTALSHADIGTVTPFSNSATICSYPTFCSDTGHLLEVDYRAIDEVASRINAGRYEEIPTAVGFCMYIKRSCITDIGYFNVEKFGYGYGEENDFCLRAASKGWKNVIAADAMVLHYGGTSFGPSKQKRVEEAIAKLERDFPTYPQDVACFITSDPLADFRLRLDLGRVRDYLAGQGFLFISHSRGGGTARYTDYLVRKLLAEGKRVAYLESDYSKKNARFRIEGISCSDIPTLKSLDLFGQEPLFERIVEYLNFEHIHIQSYIDFPLSAMREIRDALRKINVPYDVTIHDYAWFCPRINMIGASGFYCGGAEPSKCQACVNNCGSDWGLVSISHFREKHASALKGARLVFCPSASVAEYITKEYPSTPTVVVPHEVGWRTIARHTRDRTSPLRRVLIIGAIGDHKGSAILLKCAQDALKRALPIEYVVVGYTNNQRELSKCTNVTCTGPYAESDAVEIVARSGGDLCWFPAVWPETFSYTYNIALNVGVYPVAFDFGAIAERIKATDWGTVIDPNDWDSPQKLNDMLLAIEIRPTPAPDKLRDQFLEYPEVLKDYYQLTSSAS